ncbi:MAG: hypothetical protein BGO49_28505 [Planctomycetales bacterium 71-10]|nr:MAG: hypothetical protein BGO49_28505 [Planctomycetales bacterium 71-10]
MTAFHPVTSIQASRPQLYNARRAAQVAGDHAAQNSLEWLLDRAMWPIAISGLTVAAAFPAAVAFAACTSLTGRPDARLEPASITSNRKEVAR